MKQKAALYTCGSGAHAEYQCSKRHWCLQNREVAKNYEDKKQFKGVCSSSMPNLSDFGSKKNAKAHVLHAAFEVKRKSQYKSTINAKQHIRMSGDAWSHCLWYQATVWNKIPMVCIVLTPFICALSSPARLDSHQVQRISKRTWGKRNCGEWIWFLRRRKPAEVFKALDMLPSKDNKQMLFRRFWKIRKNHQANTCIRFLLYISCWSQQETEELPSPLICNPEFPRNARLSPSPTDF